VLLARGGRGGGGPDAGEGRRETCIWGRRPSFASRSRPASISSPNRMAREPAFPVPGGKRPGDQGLEGLGGFSALAQLPGSWQPIMVGQPCRPGRRPEQFPSRGRRYAAVGRRQPLDEPRPRPGGRRCRRELGGRVGGVTRPACSRWVFRPVEVMTEFPAACGGTWTGPTWCRGEKIRKEAPWISPGTVGRAKLV